MPARSEPAPERSRSLAATTAEHRAAVSVCHMTTSGHVRPILTDENPLLRHVSVAAAPSDTALRAEIADMAATLQDFRARAGFGRAISAPQIGILKRVVVMDFGDGELVLLNPQIVEHSSETQQVWDDCLSVPDKLVLVERYAAVTVVYTTLAGEELTWSLPQPDLAELLQHEIDHLDGVLMTDRMIDGEVRAIGDRVTPDRR